MTREETIRQAVRAARKDWLHYNVRQERAIYKLLSEGADRIQTTLTRYAEQGKLPPGRLVSLLGKQTNPHPDSIRGILRRLRPDLHGHIAKGMRQSINLGMETYIHGMSDIKLPRNAKLGIGTSFIGKDGKIRPYNVGVEKWKNSVWGRINGDAMDFLMRTQYGRVTLSEKVWDITWEAEKAIRNRINTGVLLGESVDKIGREIRPYLAEPNARFHRVRKDGRLVLSQPARRYHPGRGVYRSAYQNARRNSDRQNALIEHNRALQRVINDMLTDHLELYKRFSDDDGFRTWLSDTVFRLTYETPEGSMLPPGSAREQAPAAV